MRGGAELIFSRAREQTVLSKSCWGLPLQIQRPIRGPTGEAIVTLLCPTGDLLEGDELHLEVICEPGTDVVLRQASATRLHGCEQGKIAFTGRFQIGAEARLRYLPWELIPYAQTDYCQRLQVDLDENGEAVLWEVLGPGRVWEIDAPRRVSLEVVARVQGHVAFADILRMNRPNRTATAGHTHVGSLLLLGQNYAQQDADRIHDALVGTGLVGSASRLPQHGVGARALGDSADALFRAFEGLLGY